MVTTAEIGEFIHSGLGILVTIVVIMGITTIIERIVSMLLRRSFDRASGKLKVDRTTFTVFKHFVSGVIYVLGIAFSVYLIPPLRAISYSIFAGAGVLAVIAGFAGQQAFSNIVSGIFIAVFKPFRVGDLIEWGDKIGKVEDINLRHTVVKDFQNRRIIVPNSRISEETILNHNLNDDKIRSFVEFSIGYDSDVDKAMKIMKEEAMKHPNFVPTGDPNKTVKNPVPVRIIRIDESSVVLTCSTLLLLPT